MEVDGLMDEGGRMEVDRRVDGGTWTEGRGWGDVDGGTWMDGCDVDGWMVGGCWWMDVGGWMWVDGCGWMDVDGLSDGGGRVV